MSLESLVHSTSPPPHPLHCELCRIRFTNFVKGQSVDWALGALIVDLLNTSHPQTSTQGSLASPVSLSQGGSTSQYSDAMAGTPRVDPGRAEGARTGAGAGGSELFMWRPHAWVAAAALALCCFLGTWMRPSSERRRPAGTTIYDLEKGRYIVTSAPRTSMSRSR